MEFAALDLADRNQRSGHGDEHGLAIGGRIAAAQKHALAVAKPHSVGLGKPNFSEIAQRKLDTVEMRVAALDAAPW